VKWNEKFKLRHYRPYIPGFQVDGIRWDPEFSEHNLEIHNRSKITEIHDLRAELRMPGGIVQHRILSQEGVDGITFSPVGIGEFNKVNREGLIFEPITTYPSAVRINIIKILAEGHLKLKLILTLRPSWPTSGFFLLRYHYSEIDSKVTYPVSRSYRVLMSEDPRGFLSLDIDTTAPLNEPPPLGYGRVFE
jgi:hypothetical protein